MATDDSDRRQDERAEVSEFAVVLARFNPGVPMTIESISIGGARLAGVGTFDERERVQVLFEVNGTPLDVEAEVIRVEHRELLTDRIAVRFVALSEAQRTLIRTLVNRALDRER